MTPKKPKTSKTAAAPPKKPVVQQSAAPAAAATPAPKAAKPKQPAKPALGPVKSGKLAPAQPGPKKTGPRATSAPAAATPAAATPAAATPAPKADKAAQKTAAAGKRAAAAEEARKQRAEKKHERQKRRAEEKAAREQKRKEKAAERASKQAKKIILESEPLTADAKDRQSLWSRAGKAVTERTAAKILKEAGLLWRVEKREAGFELEPATLNTPAVYQPVPNYFFVVRSDTNTPFAAARSKYSTVQNADLFAQLDPLIAAGHAMYAHAGEMRKGKDVWVHLTTQLPKDNKELMGVFGPKSPFALLPNVVVLNNHSGQRRPLLFLAPFSVATCAVLITQPTTALAPENNKRGLAKLAPDELWGRVVSAYTRFAQDCHKLHSTAMTEKEFESTVVRLLVRVKGDDGETASQRGASRRETLFKLFKQDGAATTRWSAFRSVGEWVDQYFPSRSGRARIEFDGTPGALKRKMFHLLTVSASAEAAARKK